MSSNDATPLPHQRTTMPAGTGTGAFQPGNSDADRKAFETLRARAALAGYSLARTDRADGPPRYILSRWNLCRELATVAEVEQVLTRIGAPG
jgi:hypothetical protein